MQVSKLFGREFAGVIELISEERQLLVAEINNGGQALIQQ